MDIVPTKTNTKVTNDTIYTKVYDKRVRWLKAVILPVVVRMCESVLKYLLLFHIVVLPFKRHRLLSTERDTVFLNQVDNHIMCYL